MMRLTKQDIQAFKQCTDVVFRYVDGICTIEAIKRANYDSVFKEETRRDVKVGYLCTIYDHKEPGYYFYLESAFDMCGSCQYDSIWNTVASLLKEGDDISLHWIAGAMTTDRLREVSFFGDHVDLVVKRETGRGERRLTFRVGSTICQNNSARMCQVRRKSYAAA